MRDFRPFDMERWQSTYEYVVDYNLSESGVHPLTVAELCSLAGGTDVSGIRLGYGQSNGSRLLRERIARLYGGATVDNVSVTNGSAEANFAAMWTLVGPGDEVAVVAPTYMQTAGLGANFGASVKEIPLRQENGWQPDPEPAPWKPRRAMSPKISTTGWIGAPCSISATRSAMPSSP
jgi:aspartate/methionine/tyrosine aminotransferase